MLGLLGAVSGLVSVFATLGESAAGTDPRVIAKGISEALSTTIVGLAIAIPSLIAYSYFSKKVETMAVEMESLIADLLAKCYHQQQKRTAVQERTLRRVPGNSVRFYSRKRRLPTVIIVSLIDILAILLIFVIVTTTFRREQPQVVIKLPESKSGDGGSEHIRADGAHHFGKGKAFP